MKAFRIEIAEGQRGDFFDVRPLGNNLYEIWNEEEQLAIITLNEEGHTVKENTASSLGTALLNLIGEQIRFHEQMHPRG